ncbi:MAG: hypothetical protein M1500_03510 [Candidatus Marsarchaeota archaeon]|jgi:uncharacterized protein (UPF0333 family)|nr:hypothetical protein [Candidatus Marsarchaeota archaeon]MCL5112748.1 hypothetical protein [Candidatus Marsarchaeota archaeon]
MSGRITIGRSQNKGQTSIEYAAVIVWSLVVVSVVIVGIYFYVPTNPTGSEAQTCSFDTGAHCYDFMLGANSSANSATLVLLADNQNQYPLVNPQLMISMNGFNTSPMSCTPGYIAPGESFVCTATVWGSGLSAGKYFRAPVYLKAQYCGMNSSYISGTAANCLGAPAETYEGSVEGYAVKQVTNPVRITLSAQTYNAVADGSYDNVYAAVTIFGTPIHSAGINFTVNNTAFGISSPFVMSAANGGIATTDVYSNQTGNVLVSATYGSYTANITINFQS